MKYKVVAVLTATALAVGFTPIAGEPEQVQAKTVSKKGYTLSKSAGTYSGLVKVKLKAKKGYKVYYSTTGTLSVKKVLKSKKSKTFTIKKTKTLYIYAVKNSKKVTAKILKKKTTKNKIVKYKYKISKKTSDTTSEGNSPTATVTGSGETNTTTAATETAAETPTATPTAAPTVSPNVTLSESAETVQNSIDAMVESVAEMTAPAAVEAVKDISSAETISLTSEGAETTSESVEVKPAGTDTDSGQSGTDATQIEIKSSGTYVISGGTSSSPITNVQLFVTKKAIGDVNIVFDNLNIDNSGLSDDTSVFTVKSHMVEEMVTDAATGENTTTESYQSDKSANVIVTIKGSCSLKGNGNFTKASKIAPVISAKSATTLAFAAYDSNSSLTVVDSMKSTLDFGDEDPADGIAAKGSVTFQSGTYHITANGDCVKGTGEYSEDVNRDGAVDEKGGDGVVISGGTLNLTSNLSSAVKSKNGDINIYGGEINSKATAGDTIKASNYGVNVAGGTIVIDSCYGDGIQGETVYISEDVAATNISIKTYYDNATKENPAGKTKTETTTTVTSDTGSQKGIKAGTKACTYSYKQVADGSDYVANKTYTQKASGGLTITGGTINVDTTNTGIRFNGGSGSSSGNGGFGMPGGNAGAQGGSDSQTEYGSPSDAIKSNNTALISGGDITINSSSNGIESVEEIAIIDGANINILQAYEGIESGLIEVGTSSDSTDTPTIYAYTNDDGFNASAKTVNYVYTDETELAYTKTKTSTSNSALYIVAGNVTVEVADETTHKFGLNSSVSYSASGDGLDSNGSMYLLGGTTLVIGPLSGGNGVFDIGDGNYTFEIGSGATVLGVGTSDMAENPTSLGQPYVVYNTSVSQNTALAIQSDSEVLAALTVPKQISYLLFSSPVLTEGTSYSLYTGGTVSGTAVNKLYSGYSGGSLSATATASTTASSAGGMSQPGGNPGEQGGNFGGNQGGPGGNQSGGNQGPGGF